MPELLDLYDENARKTGKIIVRGTPIRNGEYSMSVHMYIYNSAGQFLLQKRSMQKKSLPGIWSVTCGAVSSGENSIEAGIREAREELGLTVSEEQFEFIGRIKRRHSFINVYFLKLDFDLSKLVLQKEEVDAVRLCRSGELLNIIRSTENVGSTYLNALTSAIKERNL